MIEDADEQPPHDAPPPSEPLLLFVISAPHALEERVLDWLLEKNDIGLFSSASTALHGADVRSLRGAEKVSGRQRRTEFRVQLPSSRLDAITRALDGSFAGTDLHWFALPLAAAGRPP